MARSALKHGPLTQTYPPISHLGYSHLIRCRSEIMTSGWQGRSGGPEVVPVPGLRVGTCSKGTSASAGTEAVGGSRVPLRIGSDPRGSRRRPEWCPLTGRWSSVKPRMPGRVGEAFKRSAEPRKSSGGAFSAPKGHESYARMAGSHQMRTTRSGMEPRQCRLRAAGLCRMIRVAAEDEVCRVGGCSTYLCPPPSPHPRCHPGAGRGPS